MYHFACQVPKLRALSTFTRTMFITRGRPSAEDVELFLKAGYSERQVLEIILALAVKTMSNYSNHLFDLEIDPYFQIQKMDEINANYFYLNKIGFYSVYLLLIYKSCI